MVPAARGDRRRRPLHPVGDDFRLDLSNLDELLRGVKLLVVTWHVERARHQEPDQRTRRRAPTAPARSSRSTARSRVSTARPTSRALDIDFLAFSGHKMLGPTGIGVLWTRQERPRHDAAVPRRRRHDRRRATRRIHARPRASPASRPARHPIAEAVGLHAAVRYLEGLGMDNVAAHERSLTDDALDAARARLRRARPRHRTRRP